MIINVCTGSGGSGASAYSETLNAAGGYTATLTISEDAFEDVNEKEY